MNKDQGFRLSLLTDISTACLFSSALYSMSSFPCCSGPPVHSTGSNTSKIRGLSMWYRGDLWCWDPAVKYRCLCFLNLLLDEGTAESSQGEMCLR